MTELLGRLITILDVDRPGGLRSRAAERSWPAARGSTRLGARLRRQGHARHSHRRHALIDRLGADKSLRRVCGWERRAQVPSEATFSRAFTEFAQGDLPDKMHAALIDRALGGRIIGTIARDATEIEAREKPVEKEKNSRKTVRHHHPPSIPPRKRGRPRKDEQRPKPEPTRLERQTSQNANQMLAELPTACDVGAKKNSKGYRSPGSATSCISMSPAAKSPSLAY